MAGSPPSVLRSWEYSRRNSLLFTPSSSSWPPKTCSRPPSSSGDTWMTWPYVGGGSFPGVKIFVQTMSSRLSTYVSLETKLLFPPWTQSSRPIK